MTPGARVAAAAEILDAILDGSAAEQALTGWARHSRFAGSKDRAAVRDHVFDALRSKLSFAALGGAMTGRGLMIGQFRSEGGDLGLIFNGQGYGAAALSDEESNAGRMPEADFERMNLPEWLVPLFRSSLGDKAEETAALLTKRAPLMLRVNAAAGSVTDAISALAEEGITATFHPLADTALIVTEGVRRVRLSEAFETGLVEFQDAASQAVVNALPLENGQNILDFCAGGGGKTLAIAARVNANLSAFDANPARMKDLPVRADRAKARVRILQQEELTGRGPYDLVLCDVPCSGSGAWRRDPAGKWALSSDKLNILNELQDEVLSQASALVAQKGVLAYCTCSVLTVENRDRIDTFLSAHPDWSCKFERSFSLSEGGDGFYTAHLMRV